MGRASVARTHDRTAERDSVAASPALDVVDRFAPTWLLIREGFYSIVQKVGDAELCVRARDAGDLDRLRKTYMPELGLR
jgi:hypothetical protein